MAEENGTKRIVTIDLLKEVLAKREEAAPHEHYEPTLGATFLLRPITGAQLDRILHNAQGEDERYREWLIRFAVVEPQIDRATWQAIQQLPSGVRGRLILAIQTLSSLPTSETTDEEIVEGKDAR